MRPWIVIPLVGLASGAVALGTHHPIDVALALALAGAALAAAIRAFNGPSLAAALSAAAGAALGILGLLALPQLGARVVVASASAMFSICELARARPPNASPLPAVGGAVLAGVLDPSYVALIAIAGWHLVVAPWPHQRRWMIALPIVGVVATGVAVVVALSRDHALWLAWSSIAAHAGSVRATVVELGDLLGPMTACAALAGLALCATRGRFAAAAVGAVIAMTVLGDLVANALGPATPLVAALGAGVAIARLAALIRWPPGQAVLGATAGFMLVVVPAWTLVASA